VSRWHTALNTNLLFKWRREHLRAQGARTSPTPTMLPVVMAQDLPESMAARPLPRPSAACVIELELPGGRIRLKGAVDITVVGAPGPDAARMIGMPSGTRIWLAAGVTDMRKSFDGLAALVQTQLHEDAFSGHVFVFRGRKGDRVKILWWSGRRACACSPSGSSKASSYGRRPRAETVSLSAAQLAMLLEGIDWRRPQRTWQPQYAA